MKTNKPVRNPTAELIGGHHETTNLKKMLSKNSLTVASLGYAASRQEFACDYHYGKYFDKVPACLSISYHLR